MLDDDVVDGDEDEFDEEASESHDDEPDRRLRRHLGDLLAVRLIAVLDEADAVLGELMKGGMPPRRRGIRRVAAQVEVRV